MNKYINYINKLKNIYNNKFFYSKLSTKKQVLFFKKLSFLIKSGSDLVESINILKNQYKSKQKKKIFDKVISDIKNGKSLASSMEIHREIFDIFVINIIKAGELSGNLITNLDYLANELQKKNLLKNKIKNALVYPLIIIFSTLSVTTFLIIYIFPKIIPIFQSLNTPLPLSTKIILFISIILKNYFLYIFFLSLALIISIFYFYKHNYKVKLFFDKLFLQLPLISKILKTYYLTSISRNMGLLLKSDLPINQSLLIIRETIKNIPYKESLKIIHHEIHKGKNISDTMILYPNLYPDIICHMVSIGEKSGQLSDSLLYLSIFYENEFDEITKNLSNSIEPLLMIIMGLTVGFIAISFITPIYEITNSLKK
jgi:type IV pilus assembly protein PilC